MWYRRIIPSPKNALSPRQVLQLTNMFLVNAYNTDDKDIGLTLCQYAEATLSEARVNSKKHSSSSSSSSSPEEQDMQKQIATAYYQLGELLQKQGLQEVAQALFKRSEKWGIVSLINGAMTTTTEVSRIYPQHGSSSAQGVIQELAQEVDQEVTQEVVQEAAQEMAQVTQEVGQEVSEEVVQDTNSAHPSADIFQKNGQRATFIVNFPEPDSDLTDTSQLAYCLSLLEVTHGSVDKAARDWLELVENEPNEHERLKALATCVIRAFKRDELKDAKAVAEVMYLAPVLEKDDFRSLLKEFFSGNENSGLLDIHQLQGLAQLIQCAETSYLDPADLVKILGLLHTRLQDTHEQSALQLYQLVFAVSLVLDAMADADVKGLDRETIHAPLLSCLDGLKKSSDSYLVYQAAYAYQALLCVPDNESLWKATRRRTGKVIEGLSGIVSAVKGIDLNEFMKGLGDIQQGLAGASEVVKTVKNAYEGASSLAKSGQGFLECLKEGLSFTRKCAWYTALRGADMMIQDGRFTELKALIYEAPCRYDTPFQWGICQRLGEVAANTTWDDDTRHSAIALLGEIYRNDAEWGQQSTIKQWILDILMQLSSSSGSDKKTAGSLLQQLRTNGDTTKQSLYQECRKGGPGPHQLKVEPPVIGSPSLIDRAQERVAVDSTIRQLRRQRLKERGNEVYIPPRGKSGLQARDDAGFPLMEKVAEFLASDQTVFLLLGESGAGKSTFNRQLEFHLWDMYGTAGAIPLFINLPAIEKPEHDMIVKQLRRYEFTEPQIRELKFNRTFVLICDGYDESQHAHNLYTSNRLNEPREWGVKMVISCRSEYIGTDYRDRFQPSDINQRSHSPLFQEAAITPFSWDQVQDYIDKYVSIHRPLWEAEDYKNALDHTPSLKELVKNPFLMSLSLDVLPRIVDLSQGLSTTHTTRVALYDKFIEHWLEREKRRLERRSLSPQARSAFESLSDEGFIQNGVDFLKKLSKAIYRNQDGQPIVRYSRYKDEDTWKSEFFSRDEEKQLLREACPLVRNGNQHRFIHRSLLEYGIALAVFDPQDWKERMTSDSTLARRRSVSSTHNLDVQDAKEDEKSNVGQGLDVDSPLAWRHFINDPSVLQFLEERVQQEPLFKQQLHDYMKYSKNDKKWRIAASNAITILVRTGVQFNQRATFNLNFPEPDSRLTDTSQLAYCLSLLEVTHGSVEIVDKAARDWLELVENEPDEHERLKALATDVIRAFKRDELKDAKAVTEVIYLAPVLEKDDFRYLLKEFFSGIEISALLDIHQLQGLAKLVQGADTSYLDPDDLVKVLKLLGTRLQDTHEQSAPQLYQLTFAMSLILDAMADADVEELDRETIHAPLLSYLDGLKKSSDPYLVYQAAYAYQALLCVPDNESLWKATRRRTGKVIEGLSGIVSAVKGIDLIEFMRGLGDIQQGLAGASEVVKTVKNAYEGASSLAKSGQGFLECLKEGLSFTRKCAWYTALRGADMMIQDGRFTELKALIYEAPCRYDTPFQWGICQRLGEVAANTTWDDDTRNSTIALLGEIYRNDAEWGQQSTIKQWILDILMQLGIPSGADMQAAESLLQQLRTNGDTTKQSLYQECRESGPGPHQLKVEPPVIGSPSLLDRVQERAAVEGTIRQLRRQRLKERGNAVYIPPRGKSGLQASYDAGFPLMEKVAEFLASDQTVFLLLGESGAGKSTFNRQLECQLWETYKNTSRIPLFINLPAIEKPEHDMIAKQLRRYEFTEPQIRELKFNRTFVLICDGYDESQQTHNLYMSNRLNGLGEWDVKMVISCRSEYIGIDYRDRFQPGDRNQRSEPSLFQEAAITPFSWDQVQDYIDQYVSIYRPLWEAREYKVALDRIPSLKESVKNPFLMSLSLDVLPRMVDPSQDLSTTHITRMALYDQFIDHWLERGKKRLGEKNLSPQARFAFNSLSDEGFIQNGVDFLKRLSKAIYKNQDGQPFVRYSRYRDKDTWKSEFFSQDEEKQLLCEVCPLTWNGNQYRFIHRSLLEYGIALAVFDPQDWKERMTSDPTLTRRGSVSSTQSFDVHDAKEDEKSNVGQGLDVDSPLAWRHFINDPSVLQFLGERVQQEPLFKQQLYDYIEHSKNDKKWRIAASNAITILVRTGVQFNNADLTGVQIPKADLSYGIFELAQFQGADLRQVNFRGAVLQCADLSSAHMSGAQFGEHPYLNPGHTPEHCAYSHDGQFLSVVLDNNTINVFSTSTWERLWTMRGHSKKITHMECSPTRKQLATGSYDLTVRIWDIESGECRYVLRGHRGQVQHVAFSPAGDQVASASDDCTVRLWNVESGVCDCILIGHVLVVACISYSPKEDQITTSSEDKMIRLWNIETKECTHILRGHEEYIQKVTHSPQGDQLASSSSGGDYTVRLWDTTTGTCLHVLKCSYRMTDFVYSATGHQIVSISEDGIDFSAQIWDTTTGECLHTLPYQTRHAAIAFSPQEDIIALGATENHTLWLWDTRTGVCRQIFTGHCDDIIHIAFSPRGDQLASCSLDKTVRLWDVGAVTPRLVSSSHCRDERKVTISPKGDQMATFGDNTETLLWDLETRLCLHVLRGHTDKVHSIAYSPRGDKIATASGDSTVQLWSAETGAYRNSLIGHMRDVLDVAYSPDGRQLASAGFDHDVRLWDVVTGECQHVLKHPTLVLVVRFSPAGDQIASGDSQGSLRLWDRGTGTCIRVLEGHKNRIKDITYSQQGDFIVSTSKDRTARVWDVATGHCPHLIKGLDGAFAYSPQVNQIAYGCEDGSVKLVDAVSGKYHHTLEGHSGRVGCIAYSLKGNLVASGGHGVRLWDVSSGQCLGVIEGGQGFITDLTWIDKLDRLYLDACFEDGVVRRWQVRAGGNGLHVSLRWRSTTGELTAQDAQIQGARGLSRLNQTLLQQRGAVGEPYNVLHGASKKVISMASVISKLKLAGNSTAEESSAGINSHGGQREQVEHRDEWSTWWKEKTM